MDIEKIMQEVQADFGMGELTYGITSDFAREVAKRAVKAEREACANTCRDEYVDALGSGCPEDFAYNNALEDAAASILARSSDELTGRASPASVPEGWKLVPMKADVDMQNAGGAHLTGITSYAYPTALKVYAAMLAAAPTPPVSEDRKDADLWRDLVSHQKFNNVPAVGYAINQAKKRQAMQESKP